MFRQRTIALFATLLVAGAILPAAATAMPARDGGFVRQQSVTTSQPAPTVRTVVKEEAIRAIPIALAGAALLVAMGGIAFSVKRVTPLRQ